MFLVYVSYHSYDPSLKEFGIIEIVTESQKYMLAVMCSMFVYI